jgi:hypothetical protein
VVEEIITMTFYDSPFDYWLPRDDTVLGDDDDLFASITIQLLFTVPNMIDTTGQWTRFCAMAGVEIVTRHCSHAVWASMLEAHTW